MFENERGEEERIPVKQLGVFLCLLLVDFGELSDGLAPERGKDQNGTEEYLEVLGVLQHLACCYTSSYLFLRFKVFMRFTRFFMLSSSSL